MFSYIREREVPPRSRGRDESDPALLALTVRDISLDRFG